MSIARSLSFATALAFASAAFAQTPSPEHVLSSVTLSFGDTGDADRAVLVENGDAGADLYIFLAPPGPLDDAGKRAPPAKPVLLKTNAAWNGQLWGTRPTLEVSGKGSLLIKSENTGIGRSHWEQTLTVVYRNKEFVVAGLTYAAYDTLDPKANGSCDLNFLSGKGKRNGKPVDLKTAAPKLADWSNDKLPKECEF